MAYYIYYYMWPSFVRRRGEITQNNSAIHSAFRFNYSSEREPMKGRILSKHTREYEFKW